MYPSPITAISWNHECCCTMITSGGMGAFGERLCPLLLRKDRVAAASPRQGNGMFFGEAARSWMCIITLFMVHCY